MKLFALLLLFPCLAHAQVSIQLSSELPFILVIDGYVQNTEEVKSLQIDKLDSGTHRLHLQLKNEQRIIMLNRRLKLVENGIHRYVISTNFSGEHQMRYRGETTQVPPGTIRMNLQKLLPYPTAPLAYKDESSLKITEEIPMSESTAGTEKEEVKAAEKPSEEPAPETVKKDEGEVLWEKLAAAEFEFVKLNLILDYLVNHQNQNTEVVGRMLKAVSYDNSRLEIVAAAHSGISDPQNLDSLLPLFEYEMSRGIFRNKYLP